MKPWKKNKPLRITVGIGIGLAIYFFLVWLLVEVERDSSQSALVNYQNAIWYTLVTLTTVGYGDIFPATVYGRFIAYIFILASIGVFGLLMGQFINLISTLKEHKRMGHTGTNFSGHAIIIGWNDFSRMVADQLSAVGKKVAIVTSERDHIDHIEERYDQSQNVFTLFSDFNNFEMLTKANIEESLVVFVNQGNDTEKLVYILNVRKAYPRSQFVVTLDNGDLKETFISAGVTNCISKNEISSKLLASYMFEPDVAEFSESILSFAKADSDYDIKQLMVSEKNPYLGKAYQDVFFDMKKRFNSVLIGITKRDKYGAKKLLKNPAGELKIEVGDYLVIISNGKAFKVLSKIFGVEEGYLVKEKK
jgi:voltage-gated potassium channel